MGRGRRCCTSSTRPRAEHAHWNAITIEDGECTLVDRSVIHAATRFGPYRFEEFSYVTDKKRDEFDFR
jgi:hypothetical protein